MRKRDVFLDFTSLLDVVLIILFFFILFSNLELEDNRVALDIKMTKAEELIQETDEKMKEVQHLKEQLEKELEQVRQFDERIASNIEAIFNFDRGENMKLILRMDDNGWELDVFFANEIVNKINSSSDVTKSISDAISKASYGTDDTLICEFILDGSEPGTNSAYRRIIKALDEVKSTYNYFYYSFTDTSKLEE